MKLSVVIVNYNVRAYLEQCLRTVQEAMNGLAGEVFVVDNQSTDGSVDMVRSKFPQVNLISNAENVGFSRANNQAIKQSQADYVVLLNPDTVVGEDVFRKVVEFLDAHPKAGGLGVKMIDGKGEFLPESKRGLPTPAVAFYKIIGLTRLFPHSQRFGRYHLGHLAENVASRIEILSGACMFLRKKTLDEVGLLDESFFMYGEDIDLSYRITLGGYENWYLPDARIIHYKGESTKKSSVNYVFVFYNAMAIFAKKHFTRRGTDFFSLLINGSIYLSAAGAIVARFLKRSLLPVLDLVVCFLIAWGWHRWSGLSIAPWPQAYLPIIIGLPLCFGLFGAYDLPMRLLNVLKSSVPFALLATLIAEMNWAGKPHPWEDTPLLFTLFLALALCIGLGTRALLHFAKIKPYSLRSLDRKRVLAIGSADETAHALALLWQTHFGLGRQRIVLAEEVQDDGAAERIRKLVRKKGIDEVVFCAKDLRWGRIIELMESLRRSGAMLKIAQPEREFIIGPNSIESLNDLFIMERHAVNSAAGRRTKRAMDLLICTGLFLAAPIALLMVQPKQQFIRNWWSVLTNERTWVGYGRSVEQLPKLPHLRPGVLDPLVGRGINCPTSMVRANVAYAKDYSAWQDLKSVLKGLSFLGQA